VPAVSPPVAVLEGTSQQQIRSHVLWCIHVFFRRRYPCNSEFMCSLGVDKEARRYPAGASRASSVWPPQQKASSRCGTGKRC
jgi:hypothetical protein